MSTRTCSSICYRLRSERNIKVEFAVMIHRSMMRQWGVALSGETCLDQLWRLGWTCLWWRHRCVEMMAVASSRSWWRSCPTCRDIYTLDASLVTRAVRTHNTFNSTSWSQFITPHFCHFCTKYVVCTDCSVYRSFQQCEKGLSDVCEIWPETHWNAAPQFSVNKKITLTT